MVSKLRKSGERCHAFITMSTEAEALQCIMWLNKSYVNGMKFTVERVRPPSIHCFVYKPDGQLLN